MLHELFNIFNYRVLEDYRKRFLMASGRSEKELQGVTMLGHKTDYPTDYAPQVLEHLITNILIMITLLSLTVLSSLAYVL